MKKKIVVKDYGNEDLKPLLPKDISIERESSSIISGYVKDENNNPLPNVNISISGRIFFTVSNANGFYSITNEKDKFFTGTTLIFDLIGYKRASRKITSFKQPLEIKLIVDEKMLKKVFVMGGIEVVKPTFKTKIKNFFSKKKCKK